MRWVDSQLSGATFPQFTRQFLHIFHAVVFVNNFQSEQSFENIFQGDDAFHVAVFIQANVVALMQADNRVELYEWALYRVLLHYLEPPARKLSELGSIRSIKLVGKACGLLLSAMALAGEDETPEGLQAAQQSFSAAAQALGLQRLQFVNHNEYSLKDLSRALQVLNRLQPLQKPRLLKALCTCVTHDGVIKPVEVELVRAVAATLDCPMPPLMLD